MLSITSKSLEKIPRLFEQFLYILSVYSIFFDQFKKFKSLTNVIQQMTFVRDMKMTNDTAKAFSKNVK
ncbi:hypothetical protein [Streptococcus mutans]|uniref:hypothetical protein n=1 Tax=Streptococcus mutans TaxID=1309 RepID=UPI0002B522C6|nr:hypothetical protein [Streptococcus mutans]EMC03801.1 hypothetical protein SMU70_09267 [Streptococcus mutans NLML5]MCB5062125.1 hypothetical protein [Streptococcus mutans]